MRNALMALCGAVLFLSTGATAADAPPLYVFQHACKSGISVKILTSNAKVQEALEKLFAGNMTAYEFLDFTRENATPANASRDEAAALDMLSKCMEITIQRI